jgi:hypothetical protein
VRVSPPLAVAECKLRPSREDLIEWLRRIGQSGNLDTQARFLLVYGMTSGTLLSSIAALRRLAVEAGEALRTLDGEDRSENDRGRGKADPGLRRFLKRGQARRMHCVNHGSI